MYICIICIYNSNTVGFHIFQVWVFGVSFFSNTFCQSWSCQEHKITECSIHELLGWMHYEYDPWLIRESTHVHFSCILKALNLPFSMPFFLSWGQEEQVVVFARDPFPFHSLYHICSATSQRLGGFQVFAGLRRYMAKRCLFRSEFSWFTDSASWHFVCPVMSRTSKVTSYFSRLWTLIRIGVGCKERGCAIHFAIIWSPGYVRLTQTRIVICAALLSFAFEYMP